VVGATDGDDRGVRRRDTQEHVRQVVGAIVIMEGIAFLAIITAAITSTFVARAQAQRESVGAAAEDLAEDHLHSELEDLAGRLDRVEKMLIKLTEE
jgi:voltage-gated potassium channel